MTAGRICTLLVAFAVIALAVVYLRAEQTRCAARTLAIESMRITVRRELWRVQAGVARLQAPTRIRDRMDWFQTEPDSLQIHGQSCDGVQVVSAGPYE